MRARPATRVHALLLALFLALGSGLALVHAGLVELAVLADSGQPCDGCEGQDCATNAKACAYECASAAQGVLPAGPIVAPPLTRAAIDTAALIPGGCSNSPEHGPPKLLAPAAA